MVFKLIAVLALLLLALCRVRCDPVRQAPDAVAVNPPSAASSTGDSADPTHTLLEAVKTVMQALGGRLALLEKRMLEAEKGLQEISGAPRVAFSAVQTAEQTRAYQAPTPLRFNQIHSNHGNGYNPHTGVFTAPVRGMYYLRFTVRTNNQGYADTAAFLMKNTEKLVGVWDIYWVETHDQASNGAVVPLEVGDKVFVDVLPGKKVYVDLKPFNSFSGFLLFTM